MIIYTDGSCLGNGTTKSKGGFGVVLLSNSKNLLYTYAEFEENTTNNRQEMKAILWAFEHYGKHGDLTIYSDSAYAVNTFSKWMYSWARNGWKKANNQTPENLDLVQRFYNLVMEENYRANLILVKGHNGNKWNELADDLATGRKKL